MMSSWSSDRPIWQPSPERSARSGMAAFMAEVNRRWKLQIASPEELHGWSVEQPESFWLSLWDFCQVVAETRGEKVMAAGDFLKTRFFPDARLNFAENLLRRQDEAKAIVFWGEEQVKRNLSWHALYNLTSQLRQGLLAEGVESGDRVAAFVPNLPESVAAMLASASIGALWSSCSPDFGVQGVLDRFGQIEPKVLFCADGYFYNGKHYSSIGRVAQIASAIPSVQRVIVLPYSGQSAQTANDSATAGLANGVTLARFIRPFAPETIAFAQLEFNHPLFIMFSSGTTGKPKCIVHGAGGSLLQLLKEHALHCDVRADDRVFYFTTCSWMMWNWLVAALARQATILLYDGFPAARGGNILFDYADAEGMTLLGTSAKFIDACSKAGLEPIGSHRLDKLRTITSTGSPLVAESFDYVYSKIKHDVHLASISGGTDILSCFVLGQPMAPVWRGEIQGPGLGLAVGIFNEDGLPITTPELKGELVCTQPFPCQPLGFWDDPGDIRYRKTYFERFPGVWCQGDFVSWSERGGLVIHGRSDAVLNPGGVRIGTAEIYRQAEQLAEIEESIAIGQDWQGDVRVILFVKLRKSHPLTEELTSRILKRIRDNCTPRHVPAKVIQVADIPRTRSGKLVELAVREVVHGRKVANLEVIANPEALEHYRNLPQLSTP